MSEVVTEFRCGVCDACDEGEGALCAVVLKDQRIEELERELQNAAVYRDRCEAAERRFAASEDDRKEALLTMRHWQDIASENAVVARMERTAREAAEARYNSDHAKLVALEAALVKARGFLLDGPINQSDAWAIAAIDAVLPKGPSDE